MAIAAETPVPTPNGFVLASDLKPGSYVFDSGGGIQEVLSVQSYISPDCYMVTFVDSLTLVGDRHLSMDLQTVKWRDRQAQWFANQSSHYAKKRFRRPLVRRNLAELYKGPIRLRDKWEYSLQNVEPLRYPHVDLPVPPYIVGLWYGSMLPSGRHSIDPDKFNTMQRKARAVGFNLVKERTNEYGFARMHIRPSVRESFTFAGAPIPDMLPQSYVEADLDSRLALLDGLMDAGYMRKSKSRTENYMARDSWRAIRRVQQLVEGLGMGTKLIKHPRDVKFELNFRLRNENPAKNRRAVQKIEKIGSKMCVHVETERSFVVGEGFLAVC